MKMVEYKGIYLAQNSRAYELYQEKKFKELDQHMKEVAQKEIDLLARYHVKTEQEELVDYLKDSLKKGKKKND